MTRFFAVTSSKQHELELHNPALCEELRIRDILDQVAVMTSGALVAAYELSGVHSFYHTEDMRNRAKESFEAVLRSMPERSMRLHLRFEIRHDTGGVIRQYADCARNSSLVLGSIDAERCSRWLEKEAAGEFLDHRLYAIFIGIPPSTSRSPATSGKQSSAVDLAFPPPNAFSAREANITGF
jgi:hypothetical protein